MAHLDNHVVEVWDNLNEPFEIECYLSVIGNFIPEDITSLLCLNPTDTFMRGDRKRYGPGTYEDSHWLFSTGKVPGGDVEAVLNELLESLLKVRDNILRLKTRNDYTMLIEVVVYCVREAEPGFHLDSGTISKLNELQLGIDFDLYSYSKD